MEKILESIDETFAKLEAEYDEHLVGIGANLDAIKEGKAKVKEEEEVEDVTEEEVCADCGKSPCECPKEEVKEMEDEDESEEKVEEMEDEEVSEEDEDVKEAQTPEQKEAFKKMLAAKKGGDKKEEKVEEMEDEDEEKVEEMEDEDAEEVDEELTAKQKKLDMDNDGEIDSSDLKKVRKDGPKK